MATSLTGVGAVWASLSLLAAVLCCSGFYLPFWIQADSWPMNRRKEAVRGRAAGRTEEEDLRAPPRLKTAGLPIEDAFALDEHEGEGSAAVQGSLEDAAMLFVQDAEPKEEEEHQATNLDALLAVWWKYKRENKQKKKKRKMLRIYRDENYWNDGRYTDDEDFGHYES